MFEVQMTRTKKLLSILIFPIALMLIFGFAFMFCTTKIFADGAVNTVNYKTVATLDFLGSGEAIAQPSTSDWPTDKRSSENGNITSGIISTSTTAISSRDETYQLSKHGLTTVGEPSFEFDGQNSANGYTYMINNTTGNPASYGMRSRDVQLNPNGFYRISIWYKTANGAFGTVYVNNSNNQEEGTLLQIANLTNTTTHDAVNHNYPQGWSKVELFVATNELQSYSINIGIWFGHPTNSLSLSTGVIFFDSILVQQITQVRYENDAKFDFYLNNQDKRVLTGTAQDMRRHTYYLNKAEDETHTIKDTETSIKFLRENTNFIPGTSKIVVGAEEATQNNDGSWSSPASFTVIEVDGEITINLDTAAVGDTNAYVSYQYYPEWRISMPQIWDWKEQSGSSNIVHKGAWQLSNPLPVMQTPIAPGNYKAQSGSDIGTAFVAAATGNGKIELYSPEGNNFLVQRYGAYEISFWAKTGTNVSATLTARTVRYFNDGSDPDHPENQVSQGETERSAQIAINSENSAPTNNWKKHVLVFTGHNLFDASVRLELAFNRAKNQTAEDGETEQTVDAGYIFIHDLKVAKLDTDNYAKATKMKDLTNTGTNFEINSLNPEAPTSMAIKNSAFNLATGAGFADDFLHPVSPVTGVVDWSTPQLDASQILDAKLSGIVTLPNNDVEAVPTPIHWSGSNIPLNVLRIDNGISFEHNSFVSSTFNFEQGSFHRISLRANRPAQGGYSGNAYVSIMNSSRVIAQQELAPSNSFDLVEFLIDARTKGMSGLTIALSVGRAGGGTNRANGKAYFARVTLENGIEITRAQFDASSANKIDFNSSGMHCGEIIAPAGNGLNFYKPLDYYLSTIAIADEGETPFFAVAQTAVGDSIVNSLIYDTHGVPVHSQILYGDDNAKFTLAENSFYEVVIRASIKDFKLDDDADFESQFRTDMTDDEKWLIEDHYGITFALDGFDEVEQQHAYIKTTRLDTVDFVWHFSTTESRTIAPKIIIGSEHAKIAVALTVYDFVVKPLTETQWKNREKFNSSSLLTAVEITNTNAEAAEVPDEKEEGEKKPFDWNLFFISLSSAVLVVGILLVIFVFFGRKVRAKVKAKSKGKIKKEHPKLKAFFGTLKFWEKKV